MQRKLFSLLLVALALLAVPRPAQAGPDEDKAIATFYAKNFEQAMTDFDTALQHNPKATFDLVMWLEAANRLKRIDDVVTTLEQRTEKAPTDATVQGQLAMAYMYQSSSKMSAVTSGQAAFDRALAQDPNCSVAHAALGLYYFTVDKTAKARNQLEKALEVNPQDWMANERLGEILMVEDDKPELALTRFKALVQALPNYPDGYFFVGMAAEKSKKDKEAIAAYERSIELDPYALTRSVYSRIRVARLYQDSHRKNLAVQVLQDLIRLRPDFKDAKTELADVESRK